MNPTQNPAKPPRAEATTTVIAEPIFSILDPSEGELVAFREKRSPDPEEIYDALSVIAQLMTSCKKPVTEGSPGDVFLAYQVSMRIHGEVPMMINGLLPMHGVLTPEGVDTAPGELSAALERIAMPLKNRLMKFANEVSEQERSGSYRLGR